LTSRDGQIEPWRQRDRHGRIGGLKPDPDLLAARRQLLADTPHAMHRERPRSVVNEADSPIGGDEPDGGVYAVEWQISHVSVLG